MNTPRALKPTYSFWPKLLVCWGVFLQVFSGYWDVFSHRVQFTSSDPAWNPAHLSLYTGLLVVLTGILVGRRSRFPSYDTLAFPATKLIVGGTTIEIISGVWNELWHLFSLPEPPIAPAHGLLVIGMLTVNIGTIVDLSLIYWATRQREQKSSDPWMVIMQGSLIIAFTSAWLLASGSVIYMAGVVSSAEGYFAVVAGMALISTLVIVPAMLVLGETGVATSLGVGYSFVNYLLIVIYAGRPTYVPLSFIPLLAIDLVHRFLSKEDKVKLLILVVGIISGALFPLTYYPYSVTLFTVAAVNVFLILLVSVLGNLAGAFLGYKIVGWVASVVAGSYSREVSAD